MEPFRPRVTPSYSCWASIMTFLVEKFSRLLASCWRLLVVKGGAGFRSRSRTEQSVTW